MKTARPMPINSSSRLTSVQVLEPKLPINQNIMTETCSSAIYFNKLIPADKIAATMIPERIRLLEDNPPLEADR